MSIDSEGIEQTQLVAVSEVVHEDAASVGHLGVAPDHAVQESLRRAAQEGAGQALQGVGGRDPRTGGKGC